MLAVIAAGGQAPARAQLEHYLKRAQLVIAADSGANYLAENGMAPDVLLGDFDSIDPAVLRQFQDGGVELITVPAEKDDTDTMLAARIAASRGADEVVLLGGLGGRLDHALANILVLSFLEGQGIRARMVGRNETVYHASGSHTVCGCVGDTVSIFPYMGEATVLMKGGMKYPLDHLHLTGEYPIGVSNVLSREQSPLEIQGRVLVIITSR